MTRKCPHCGEPVPSYSITCPKCFKDIPREEEKPKEDIKGNIPNDRAPSVKTVDKTVVLLLALIPAAFGIMGMAQIYEGEYKKGLIFLCIGFPIFVLMAVLISSFNQSGAGIAFLSLGMIILCGLVFVATYIIQAFDALVRSLFVF